MSPVASKRRRLSPEGVTDDDSEYSAGDVPADAPVDVDAATETQLDESMLHSELRCPICLMVMRDPVVTECLHRFCKDCIERCQRQVRRQCPSCRTPIATRRSLRPDHNIASLIKKVYPDLDAFEAEEDRALTAENAARTS